MLEIGIKGYGETMVTEQNTAKAIGSGGMDVFSTPAMIALMEKTCRLSVQPYLEEGQSTVGIHVDIYHDRSTPVGMKVHAETELVKIDRRRLTFEVRAFNEEEQIGHGTHDRFIIDIGKFMDKAEKKH